jgi:DNA-binding CsgD family transcriptional regulator
VTARHQPNRAGVGSLSPSSLLPRTPALLSDEKIYAQLRHGLSLARIGRHDEAMLVLKEALPDAQRARRPDIEAQLLSTIACQAFLSFDLAESLRSASAIIDLVDTYQLEGPAANAIAFRGHLAVARHYSQLGLEAQARAALAGAEAAGGIEGAAQLCGFLELRAIADAKAGNDASSLAAFDQLLDISSRGDCRDNYAVRLSSAAAAAMLTGSTQRAFQLYRESRDLAATFGDDNRIYVNIVLEYAWAALTAGKLNLASELLGQSETLSNSFCVRVYHCAVGLMLCALAGRVSETQPAVDAFGCACTGGIPNQIGAIAAALHAYHMSRGDANAAAEVLTKALASLVSADGCWWLLLQTVLYGQGEHVDAALRLLAPYSDRFRLARAHRLLLNARLAALRAENAASDRLAWEASLLFGELGCRYHRAVALQMAGRNALARELFAKIGVERAVAIGSRRSRRLARSAYHVALSDGDREIVRLIAEQSATNRDIAAALAMSERAVKYHLTEIFTAFGVHNRRELAARVRENGDAPS